MSYPEGHALKRSFAIMAVLGLAAVNLVGLTGAAGGGVAPQFTTAENQLVFEGETLEFYINASDADGDAVNILVLELPTGMDVNTTDPASLQLSWTPTIFDSGDWDACFRASDGTLFTETCVVVRVSDVENQPVLVPLTNRALYELQTVRFFIGGRDPDGDPLSYSLVGASPGMQFNSATRLFSWTPDQCQGGRSHVITFFVSDGSLDYNESMSILVRNINREPFALPALPAVDVIQNRSATTFAQASDADLACGDDSLRYTALTSPGGSSQYFVNPQTGQVTWNTTLGTAVGEHTFAVNVTDRFNKYVHTNVTFNVLKNELPVLLVDSPAESDVWAAATFDATQSFDPEGLGVKDFTWNFSDALPNGSEADPVITGSIAEWTFVAPGFYNVTLSARDGDGQLNTTVVPIVIDDIVNLSLKLIREQVNIISANAATVSLTTWDGQPIANTEIVIQVVHEESDEVVNEFVLTTDADGTVTFVIPRDDEELVNRMGNHIVTARTLVEDTFLGNAEEAEATAEYNVVLL